MQLLLLISLSFCNLFLETNSQCHQNAIYYPGFDKCFTFMRSYDDWLTAERKCQQLGLNGHLAKISSAFENMNVMSLIDQIDSTADKLWIGLSNYFNGTWLWSADDSAVNYSHWAPDFPTQIQVGNCGGILGLADPTHYTGYWYNEDCNAKRMSICQTIPLCLNGWSFFDQTGFCYRYFNVSAILSDAEHNCRSYGADVHLASIHSKEENSFIYGLFFESQQFVGWRGARIGFVQSLANNSTWTWTDSSPVDYVNFGGLQPDGCCGSPLSGVMSGSVNQSYAGYWDDTASSMPYVCKRNPMS